MNAAIPFKFVEEEPVLVPFQNRRDGAQEDLRHELALARAGQTTWAALSPRGRAPYFRRLRQELAACAKELAVATATLRGRPVEESLTAEVVPLLDACRHLERRMGPLLAPKKLGRRGRPAWLTGVSVEVRRESCGVVLVVGPSNYPLFLPAVQALQALAAGNAVMIKPAPGTSAALRPFLECLVRAGFDARLARMATEDPAGVEALVRMGVDKVAVTGSASTGRSILHLCARHLTPAVMELSGSDPVFIRADADLVLAARAIVFGLRLNNAATCIAPKRVFVHEAVASTFERILAKLLQSEPPSLLCTLPEHDLELVEDALSHNSRMVHGEVLAFGEALGPLVLAASQSGIRLLSEEVTSPVLTLLSVGDDEEALRMAGHSPYALGASIFTGDIEAAQRLATRVNAGVVTVNDLIVPTADPRIAFGGRGNSGFGVTRGDEGLLEMTVLKSVSVRGGKWRPHYESSHAGRTEFFEAWIAMVYGKGWISRARSLARLWQLGAMAGRDKRKRPEQPDRENKYA